MALEQMITTITFKLDGEVEIPVMGRDGEVIALMGFPNNEGLNHFLESKGAVMGEVLSEDTAVLTLWFKSRRGA